MGGREFLQEKYPAVYRGLTAGCETLMRGGSAEKNLFEVNTPVETIAKEQNEKMDAYIAGYEGPKDGLSRRNMGLPAEK